MNLSARTLLLLALTFLTACATEHSVVREYVSSVTSELPATPPAVDPSPVVCSAPLIPRMNPDAAPVAGRSVLSFVIGGDGMVYGPRVVETNLPGAVNVAILRAVSQWQFEPKTVNGQRHQVPASTTVTFSASGGAVQHDMCGRHRQVQHQTLR